MDTVPERPQPENWADLSPRQQADWLLEPISDELTELYVKIVGKGGLNLPADMVKHLTDDEWSLAISTFFAQGTSRRALADQFQSVMMQIARDRMTEPEQRRAADWMLRYSPTPDATEQSPPPRKRQAPRPKPSRLAKWEAQWQAEQSAEAER